MATPFDLNNQHTVADQPTNAQLDLIRRLLGERDWQSADNERYVRRVSAIAVALDHADNGEAMNTYLHNVVEPPMPKPGASLLIDWLKQQPTRKPIGTLDQWEDEQRREDKRASLPRADVVPAGRYAIDTRLVAINEIAFYKVDRPTEGRWAGYVFVKLITGGGGERRMSFADSKVILNRIAEVGAQAASARYGHEIGECGICGHVLTNDESRARGIGPICAEKAGW